MNTNADALSRIVTTSEELKEMIPREQVTVVTRKMTREMKKERRTKNRRNDSRGDFSYWKILLYMH